MKKNFNYIFKDIKYIIIIIFVVLILVIWFDFVVL